MKIAAHSGAIENDGFEIFASSFLQPAYEFRNFSFH
jgi:hypothetical protein